MWSCEQGLAERADGNWLILKMASSFWFCGVGRSCKSCTLLRSGFIPCAENLAPQKDMCG